MGMTRRDMVNEGRRTRVSVGFHCRLVGFCAVGIIFSRFRIVFRMGYDLVK